MEKEQSKLDEDILQGLEKMRLTEEEEHSSVLERRYSFFGKKEKNYVFAEEIKTETIGKMLIEAESKYKHKCYALQTNHYDLIPVHKEKLLSLVYINKDNEVTILFGHPHRSEVSDILMHLNEMHENFEKYLIRPNKEQMCEINIVTPKILNDYISKKDNDKKINDDEEQKLFGI